MLLSGGALTKGRIACGCILLLGFTTGTGLACTEIHGQGVSKAFGVIGEWFSEIFKSDGPSPEPQAPTQPFDPITPIGEGLEKVSGAVTTVVNLVPEGYTWINNSDNSQWVLGFFKSFWDFSFVKNVVFNFHLTVRAWLGVLVDKTILSKFPDAIKKFQSLAKFLSKTEQQTNTNGEKTMINWLYLRLFVNPRRTINVLSRGQRSNAKEGDDGLKCNGSSKRKKKKSQEENLPLGICFICKDGNKLIDQMTNFLKTGEIPPATSPEK